MSSPSVPTEAFNSGGREAMDAVAARRLDRRQFLSRAAAIGVSLPTASALLSACSSSASPNSSTPTAPTKTLSWRSTADVNNVDPAMADPGPEDYTISTCLFEGLIADKPGTGAQVNCLAESFEVSKDGLQLHFTLKQGIPWQKGYGEVQASDVKYSYERIAGLMGPNLHSPDQPDWAALESVRVDGKYEGTIILKEVFAPVLTSTLRYRAGCVVPEKAVEKLGKSFGTNPVGSGPYEWTAWVPGQKLVLTKFADYGGANKTYANKHLFEEIVANPIQSDETAYAALESGSINLCELGPTIVKSAMTNRSVKVTSYSSGNYYWLAMNVTEPPLTNIWVRRAIRQAIDVPGIIKVAYDGLYTRTNAIIPKQLGVGYWPQAPEYNQNIALAKSYLARSGLKNVTLELTVDNSTADESAAEIIAANLAEIGIKVNLQPQDVATLTDIPGTGAGGPHAQLVYYEYGGDLDPNLFFEWWTCAQVGLWNWDHWCNKEFTALVNEALHTLDVAERTRLYIEAQKMWDQEAGMVWVGVANNFIATAPYVVVSVDPAAGKLLPWNTTYT
jgi:peptide/nickel transport system substrate-binding protein